MNRALMISLQDDSSEVRKNAIRDVSRVFEWMTQVSQVLQYATSDPDAEVRETAEWALGQLNRSRLPSLEENQTKN
jgi:vesicle coat complex subunit